METRDYSFEAQQDAAEIKLRAERKLGELLAEKVNHTGGGDRKSRFRDGTAIRDLPEGVNKAQSHRFQQVAKLEEPDFERYVAETLTQTSNHSMHSRTLGVSPA